MSSVAGVTEPVVVGVNEATSAPDEPGAGATVAHDTWEGTKALGSAVPVIGHAVGAVIGAIVGAFRAIADAARTTPDDARRYLYEIGYVPGQTLKTARVTQDVSPSAKLAIRRARYVVLADKKDYGLGDVNFWLERAGETTGKQDDNPMPVETYLDLMADALIEYERERLLAGQSDVEVPLRPSPTLVKSVDPNDLGAATPLHRAVLRRLRAEPARIEQAVRLLRDPVGAVREILPLTPEQEATVRAQTAGAPEKLEAWVAAVQSRASDRGSNPVTAAIAEVRDPLRGVEWWLLGGGAVLAAGIGGAALASKKGTAMRDDIMREVEVGGLSAGKSGAVALAVGGLALAGTLAWLFFGGGSEVLAPPETASLPPVDRVQKGYVGQEVVKDGKRKMVAPNGDLVDLAFGGINQTRVLFGLVGKTVLSGTAVYVVQPDGSLKKSG